jgi:hypothetical protein
MTPIPSPTDRSARVRLLLDLIGRIVKTHHTCAKITQGTAVANYPLSILRFMDYSVGSRIRVRLYSGKVVEAEITAITNQSTGRKLQIVYGSVTASINPAQVREKGGAMFCLRYFIAVWLALLLGSAARAQQPTVVINDLFVLASGSWEDNHNRAVIVCTHPKPREILFRARPTPWWVRILYPLVKG